MMVKTVRSIGWTRFGKKVYTPAKFSNTIKNAKKWAMTQKKSGKIIGYPV